MIFFVFSQNSAISRNLNHCLWRKMHTIHFQTISDIMFLQFAVFPFKFNSPKLEHNFNSSTINLIYLLPYELLNDLGLGCRTQEMKRKSQNEVETQANVQLPKKKLFLAVAVKTDAKADIKVFCYCPNLLYVFTCCPVFCH